MPNQGIDASKILIQTYSVHSIRRRNISIIHLVTSIASNEIFSLPAKVIIEYHNNSRNNNNNWNWAKLSRKETTRYNNRWNHYNNSETVWSTKRYKNNLNSPIPCFKANCSTTPWRRIENWGYRSKFLDLSTIWKGEISFTSPAVLVPRERALGTNRIRSWVGPTAGLDDMEMWTFYILSELCAKSKNTFAGHKIRNYQLEYNISATD
jgi:hypothetical protein